MTWIRHLSEIDEKNKIFMAMSREEYDKYMCEKYPVMFKERYLPMTQTCMCWSFGIGKGWYSTLDDLCKTLDIIGREFGLSVVFSQIKEKFGGARFYYSVECHLTIWQKIKRFFARKRFDERLMFWNKIIDDTVNYYESSCDYVCAECGEHKYDMISLGSWVYDSCEKCLEKDKNRVEMVKQWRENKELDEDAGSLIYHGNKEEILKLKELVSGYMARVKKEQTEAQEKYEKMRKESEDKLNSSKDK
jgi:hypothetical protein